MKRCREALNHAIKVMIKSRTLSLSEAYRPLYNILRVNMDCSLKLLRIIRESITIIESWSSNTNGCGVPRAKTFWLAYEYSYKEMMCSRCGHGSSTKH